MVGRESKRVDAQGAEAMTERLRTWCDNATRHGGSFVKTFAMACFCADGDNLLILLPVLQMISEKYPVYFREGVDNGGKADQI